MDVLWNVLCRVCIRCCVWVGFGCGLVSLLGLRGLGKKRAPKQDGAPKEKEHDAERFRERQRELGDGEGVYGGEGEESEG